MVLASPLRAVKGGREKGAAAFNRQHVVGDRWASSHSSSLSNATPRQFMQIIPD
jgi:hypothetical protein